MFVPMEDHGRLDWMPKVKMWKVVGYTGNRDVEVGRVENREVATEILQNWVKDNRGALEALNS